MNEYTIQYNGTDEQDILYGYSKRDLAERYPNIDPSTYTVLYWEHVD